MIAEYLTTGIENARTGKDLARVLECNMRDISAGIEYERRQGQPIIASCDANQPGYYLASTPEELRQYCDRLNHRASEINKTRAALLLTAQNMIAEKKRRQ